MFVNYKSWGLLNISKLQRNHSKIENTVKKTHKTYKSFILTKYLSKSLEDFEGCKKDVTKGPI